MILYLAADLIWATKIKGAADALNVPCRPVRTLDMLEARLADSPVRALLLDLDDPETALAMIRRLRSGEPVAPPQDADPPATPEPARVRTIAFGPHVAKDLFQQARDAGADDVLPRGALEHSLPDLLLSLAGRSG
jgi:hypothetical protein